jgi:hypothetical protein
MHVTALRPGSLTQAHKHTPWTTAGRRPAPGAAVATQPLTRLLLLRLPRLVLLLLLLCCCLCLLLVLLLLLLAALLAAPRTLLAVLQRRRPPCWTTHTQWSGQLARPVYVCVCVRVCVWVCECACHSVHRQRVRGMMTVIMWRRPQVVCSPREAHVHGTTLAHLAASASPRHVSPGRHHQAARPPPPAHHPAPSAAAAAAAAPSAALSRP